MHARRLPARNGFLWLLASFRLFRANPALLAALGMAILSLFYLALATPPIGPFLFNLAAPTLVVVFTNGCRVTERGGAIGVVPLAFGVKSRRIELVQLGGANLLISVSLLFVHTAIEGGTLTPLNDEAPLGLVVRLFIISLPYFAALWFAPMLVGWDGLPPLKALFFSFIACWRNWRAFAVYACVLAVVAIALPGLLVTIADAISKNLRGVISAALLLALVPVILAGVYVSYLDVFHGPEQSD